MENWRKSPRCPPQPPRNRPVTAKLPSRPILRQKFCKRLFYHIILGCPCSSSPKSSPTLMPSSHLSPKNSVQRCSFSFAHATTPECLTSPTSEANFGR